MLTHNALPSDQAIYGFTGELREQTEAALSKTQDQMFDIRGRIDCLLQQCRELQLAEKESLWSETWSDSHFVKFRPTFCRRSTFS